MWMGGSQVPPSCVCRLIVALARQTSMQGRRMREGGLPAIVIGAFLHIGRVIFRQSVPRMGVSILSSEQATQLPVASQRTTSCSGGCS